MHCRRQKVSKFSRLRRAVQNIRWTRQLGIPQLLLFMTIYSMTYTQSHQLGNSPTGDSPAAHNLTIWGSQGNPPVGDSPAARVYDDILNDIQSHQLGNSPVALVYWRLKFIIWLQPHEMESSPAACFQLAILINDVSYSF